MAREKKSKTRANRHDEAAGVPSRRSRIAAAVGGWLMNRVRGIWALSWIFFLALAVVLALILGSYSPSDPAFSVSTRTEPSNFCGLFGAWVADLLLSAFGFSAWWFVLGSAMVAVFALRAMYRRINGEKDPRRINPPKFTAIIGFIAVLLGSTCLEALRLRRFQINLPGEPGGIVGDSLAFGIKHYIGVGLSTTVFFALIAIGLSLLMDFQWQDVAEKVGRALDFIFVRPFRRRHQAQEDSRIAAELERQHAAEAARTQAAAPAFASAGAAAAAAMPAVPVQGAAPEPAEPYMGGAPGSNDYSGSEPPSEDFVKPEDNDPFGPPKEQRVNEPAPKPAPAPSPSPVRTPAPRPAAAAQRPAAKAAAAAPGLSLDLLDTPDQPQGPVDTEQIEQLSRLIVSTLKNFGIAVEVRGSRTGPVITQYWLEPAPGVMGSQIERVRDDLRRALGVDGVRVVPTIPGTRYIGLEVPKPKRETVRLKEILESPEFRNSTAPLTLALGKDIAGKPYTVNLAKMPHLLVAGTTGSGKSVGINAMILSMLYRNTPETLRLVLIDPKMLEFSLYNDIPHLLCPVVTDMNKAAVALKWLAGEMDRRYKIMSRVGVRHIDVYNQRVRDAAARGEEMYDPAVSPDDPGREPLTVWPYIVCIIDELADLMLTNRKEVEGQITRLTQKARAAGIHLIIATQRPSADVVTSLIKANVPTRISFQVASTYDSRVILGETGAESLLGLGDMLMHRPGMQQAVRVQGCFVSDAEVQRVVEALKATGEPDYIEDVTEAEEADEGGAEGGGRRSGEEDPLYDQAVAIVLSEKRASISFVQRHLGIGYNRAANLLEAMETAGIVSKASSTGRREILVPDRQV
jgi:S-DNA-T family DNA segregation ATPase FtsK/SpoIIIE